MASKNQIIEELRKQIEAFSVEAHVESVGTVLSVADGVVRISGLSDAKSQEMLEFSNGAFGVALNIEEQTIGAVILGDTQGIREGESVKSTGRILSVPVGEAMIGRVVNPLGQPLDAKGEISSDRYEPIEKIAPGVMTRKSVSVALQTGIKAIDSLIPIGRGQRELIIGDRQTGKTAVAIDTIINQKGTGVKCVYVAIGQKESKI
ncbi:F0F1 ATP synthase subunit alpha, partial [Patescibacteria group bacterium]|nr:F0F1 ATP synthase subunit alpha [Patescibacteria group bacterium]